MENASIFKNRSRLYQKIALLKVRVRERAITKNSRIPLIIFITFSVLIFNFVSVLTLFQFYFSRNEQLSADTINIILTLETLSYEQSKTH